MISYVPSVSQLAGLAGMLGIAAALVGLGYAVNGRRMSVDVHLVSGWACLLLIAVFVGVLSAAPLHWVLILPLLVGAGVAVGMVWILSTDVISAGRLLLIALPLCLVIAAASASQWDEFAHWLVNQRYLYDVGTFPRRGLPENLTGFAAYPYGLPLLGFLASVMVGFFVENAGALFNTILILVLARTTISAFQGEPAGQAPISWMAAAAGLVAATALNPTFVPKLVFTTYADWSTAVVFGVAVRLAWRMLMSMARGQSDDASDYALHLGLALAVAVTLKQPNAILAVGLVCGIAAAAIVDRSLPIGRLVRLVPHILVAPLLIYVAWRYHVAQHLPGREFAFMPWADWLWGDLGAVLARMGLIASKKGGYFGLMLAATAVAIVALRQGVARRPIPSLGVLAMVVAVLFLTYNAFLYVAYVGAFGKGEGQNAASYWRYNTQLGGAALVFAAAAAGEIYRRVGWCPVLSRTVMTAGVVSVGLLPLLLAPKIRFDLNPVTRHVRAVGSAVKALAPANSALFVLDPSDNGKRALLLRYETQGVATVQRLTGIDLADAEALRVQLAGLPDGLLWIHIADQTIASALSLELPALSSHLVHRERGDAWKLVRSWPYAGYLDPIAEDD